MEKRNLIKVSILFFVLFISGCFSANTVISQAYSCQDIPLENVSEIIGAPLIKAELINDVDDVEEGVLCAVEYEQGEDWALLIYINDVNPEEYHNYMRELFIEFNTQIVDVPNLGEKAYLSGLVGEEDLVMLSILHKGHHIEIIPVKMQWFTVERLKEIGKILVAGIDKENS